MYWIIIGLYNIVYLFGLVFYLPYIAIVRGRGWRYVFSRMFAPDLPVKTTKRYWLHAVSVGETNVAMAVARRLVKDGVEVVISTSTPTGMENLKKKAEGTYVIYSPWDFLLCVCAFFAKIKPDRLLIIETELWPSLFCCAYLGGVPVSILNARISDRAFSRYRRLYRIVSLKGLFFDKVDFVFAQDKRAMDRFLALGLDADHVGVFGNIKFDIDILEKDIDILGPIVEGRYVIVLGSTHRDEEEQILSRLAKRWQDRFLVICAPRHVHRADGIVEIATGLGLSAERFSRLNEGNALDVVVVDVIGVLANIYRYADVVFVGGSLVPHGGQNPLEPLYWNKPVVVGPYMDNFAGIMEQLKAESAILQVSDADAVIEAFFSSQDKLKALARAAKEVFSRNRGVVERIVKQLNDFSDETKY